MVEEINVFTERCVLFAFIFVDHVFFFFSFVHIYFTELICTKSHMKYSYWEGFFRGWPISFVGESCYPLTSSTARCRRRMKRSADTIFKCMRKERISFRLCGVPEGGVMYNVVCVTRQSFLHVVSFADPVGLRALFASFCLSILCMDARALHASLKKSVAAHQNHTFVASRQEETFEV